MLEQIDEEEPSAPPTKGKDFGSLLKNKYKSKKKKGKKVFTKKIAANDDL